MAGRPDWRKKLRDEITRQNRDMKEVSLSAGLGPTYVRDALVRGRGGKLENVEKLSVALGYEPDWLLTSAPPAILQAPSPPAPISRPQIIPNIEASRSQAFNIYAAAMGGNGNLIIDFTPIEVTTTPPELVGVLNAYGILIVGESMVPAYEPGDVAYVDPTLFPDRNRDVILYDSSPTGSVEAIVKRLVNFTSTTWELMQYNPAKQWTEDRVDWPICHRITSKRSRR